MSTMIADRLESTSGGNPVVAYNSGDLLVEYAQREALITSGLLNNRLLQGNWATTTIYSVEDIVVSGGLGYYCVVTHIAGVFSTDLAAGMWIKLTNPFYRPLPGENGVTNCVYKWCNVKRYGAVGDGVTDDSTAIAAAILFATTPYSSTYIRSLKFPDGLYLDTENNFIGANLGTSVYAGLLDVTFEGDGRNSSVIIFKPSVSGGACYDQSLTPNNHLIGFSFSRLGMKFDNSNNGSNPIHVIKSVGAASHASQNFRLNETKFIGVTGSVLFTLGGTVNEDNISVLNTHIEDFESLVVSSTNLESLLHHFTNINCVGMTGTYFDYTKGGFLQVDGMNGIMEGTSGIDTAILKLGGGTTSQCYTFNNLRTELRGAETRVLIIDVASENTITFNNCGLAANITNGQAWAIVPIQHHSTINFVDCILPQRTGTGDEGTFQLVDSASGFDYATVGLAHSFINFIRCANSGDRLNDVDGWVDYSYLTAPNINYRTATVTYRGCENLPDSVEYGHTNRQGRSDIPHSPNKLIFRGTAFPYGDGSAAVVTAEDLNIVIPLNNFVTEIVVMRKAMSVATNYQIEFIDTLERTAPGTGVIFGSTTTAANNLAINERVEILTQFTGTRAERTIWCRVKTGVTLTAGQTGVPTDGGIYAEIL